MLAEVVLADTNDNIYAFGLDTWYSYGGFQQVGLAAIKYAPSGNVLWQNVAGQAGNLIVRAAAFGRDGYLYILQDLVGENGAGAPYVTFRYSQDGSSSDLSYNVTGVTVSQSHGLAINSKSDVVVTGQNAYYYPNSSYGTFEWGTNGNNLTANLLWSASYPAASTATVSVATSIAIDASDNVYVTGYSPGATSGNDIVTIKYDPNGKQQWLLRYNGPGNGDDRGNAIAVDGGGNVYVTGYETVPGGGTEMVTIKYAPLTVGIQPPSGGNVVLQAHTSPGEPIDFQATVDFRTWTNLGTNVADATGAASFMDTNAGLYPSRFYLAVPQ